MNGFHFYNIHNSGQTLDTFHKFPFGLRSILLGRRLNTGSLFLSASIVMLMLTRSCPLFTMSSNIWDPCVVWEAWKKRYKEQDGKQVHFPMWMYSTAQLGHADLLGIALQWQQQDAWRSRRQLAIATNTLLHIIHCSHRVARWESTANTANALLIDPARLLRIPHRLSVSIRFA